MSAKEKYPNGGGDICCSLVNEIKNVKIAVKGYF